MAEPTQLFRDVFMGCGGGSPTQECGCGRILFSDSDYYDPGELEQMQQKAREKPERFIALDGDACVSYEICGRTYVDGCPCDYAAKFEALLWSNRNDIAKYISERARATELEMGALVSAASRVKGALG